MDEQTDEQKDEQKNELTCSKRALADLNLKKKHYSIMMFRLGLVLYDPWVRKPD